MYGLRNLIYLSAWSPVVELFGKDYESWSYWRRCVAVGGLRGFKKPVSFPVALCLLLVDKDVRSQVGLLHQACLLVTMLPPMMAIDSNPLEP